MLKMACRITSIFQTSLTENHPEQPWNSLRVSRWSFLYATSSMYWLTIQSRWDHIIPQIDIYHKDWIFLLVVQWSVWWASHKSIVTIMILFHKSVVLMNRKFMQIQHFGSFWITYQVLHALYIFWTTKLNQAVEMWKKSTHFAGLFALRHLGSVYTLKVYLFTHGSHLMRHKAVIGWGLWSDVLLGKLIPLFLTCLIF